MMINLPPCSNSVLHITKQDLCKCALRVLCAVRLAATSERPLDSYTRSFKIYFGRIMQRVTDTYNPNPVTENCKK